VQVIEAQLQNKSLEMRWMKAIARDTQTNAANIEDGGSTGFH
jgi:hypothetical protein